MPMTMQLYCFGESGHSYKVALALTLTGQDWQPRFVDFFNGETRSPEFRALNPMGECPVLIDGDEVLTQSGSILMHLADKTGQLGGQGAAERREVLRWVLWDNHKMSSQVGMLRFLRTSCPPRSARPRSLPLPRAGRKRPMRCWTAIWRRGTGLPGRGRLSPTCRAAPISTTPNPSASRVPTGRISTAGWTGSPLFRAGSTPTT